MANGFQTASSVISGSEPSTSVRDSLKYFLIRLSHPHSERVENTHENNVGQPLDGLIRARLAQPASQCNRQHTTSATYDGSLQHCMGALQSSLAVFPLCRWLVDLLLARSFTRSLARLPAYLPA